MKVRGLKDLDVNSKTILMRVDFNVPLTEDGQVSDDLRINAALPSIKYIIDGGGKLVLVSHLGRPKGKVDPKLSMDPVAKRLSELLGKNVEKLDACVGPEVEQKVAAADFGDVLLLENVRFYPEEDTG